MAIVGIATGIGLFVMDVSLAFTLGLWAGLVSFVPYIGPLIGVVPALLIAAVDLYSLQLRAERGDDWLPGDFGFDPLRILKGASLEARREMQAKEINNGRLAMVAVLVMVIEEAVTKQPVVRLTPWLFEPVIFFPEVQQLFDQEFAAAAFRPE